MQVRSEIAQARRNVIAALGPHLPTRREVAEITGGDIRRVEDDIRVLIQQGVVKSVKPAAKTISPERAAKVKEAFAEGRYAEEICAKFKISPHQLRKMCKGVARLRPSTIKPEITKHCAVTYTPECISVTYSDSLERASRIQSELRAARESRAA